MGLDDLEKEIYRKDSHIEEERKLFRPKAKKPPEVPGGWEESAKKIPVRAPDIGAITHMAVESTRKWWYPTLKFFAVAFIIVILISGFFIYQRLTALGIALSIDAPDRVLIGEPFTITVNVQNSSPNILGNSKIELVIPNGVAILGESPGAVIKSKDIGDIGKGSKTKQSFEVIVLDGENSVKKFEAAIIYEPTLGTSFKKQSNRDIAISGMAIDVNFSVPDRVFSGENFDVALSYKNISQTNLRNIKIQVVYPPAFAFDSSDPESTDGNNIWEINDLLENGSGEIKISGNMVGFDESFFDMRAIVTASYLGQTYNISAKQSSISIAPSPLGLSLSANNNIEYIARPNDQINYVIKYENNTGVGLQDIILKVQLNGKMFDLASIQTGGFVSSLNRTITWNTANTPSFRVLSPGASGSVDFKIRTKRSYPISRLNDKDFSLKITATIESPTVPSFVGSEKTFGAASLETKVAGNITIDTKGFFRDAAAEILNTGPWPPRVNQATQYSIHWVVRNFSTDVSDIEIRGFLLAGVDWTGNVKSNIDTIPEYNSRSKEIVWKIPKMSATQGVLTDPVEAIFQISAIPPITFLNQYLPLISETTISASDQFIQQQISNQDVKLSTLLADDQTISSGNGLVRE